MVKELFFCDTTSFYWVRSECSATPDSTPNRLVAKVLVGDVEYIAEYQA